jgi:hypothetical protein
MHPKFLGKPSENNCRSLFIEVKSTSQTVRDTPRVLSNFLKESENEKVKLSRYRPEQPLGLLKVEAPEFLDNRRKKVVRLSVRRTGRF